MQKQAVFHINGPLLVLAGAGSGKTTVLVNRIANMIRYGDAYNSEENFVQYTQEQLERLERYVSGADDEPIDDIPLAVSAVRPWQILAITFTNKAATELKERLENMLGSEDADDIWAGTFHSMCARILRREGMALGYSSHFTIYDTDDSRRVMKECQQALGIDDKHLSHKVILNKISHAKDSLISPQEYAQMNEGDVLGRQIAKAYELYQKSCIMRTRWILTISSSIRYVSSSNAMICCKSTATGSATLWWMSIRIPIMRNMCLSVCWRRSTGILRGG